MNAVSAGLPTLHRAAAEALAAIVEEVAESRWDARTPCREWDVRMLVNHNVAENLWVPELMEGATIDEVGDRFDGDVLGEDPAGACRTSTEPACASMEVQGAMERTVHLSFGDLPAAEFTKQRIVDLVVHAWDLAAAAGLDWHPDAELVGACLAWGEAWRPMLEAGTPYFASPVDPPEDAGDATRLVCLFGRDPSGWR